MALNPKNRNLLIAGITIVLIALLVWNFFNLFLYVMIAGFLSLLGAPIVRFLDKVGIGKFRMPHSLNALIAMILVLGMVLSFFAVLIPIALYQARIFSEIDINTVLVNFKEPINNFEDWLIKYKIISPDKPLEVVISNYFLGFVKHISIEQFLTKIIDFTSEVVISLLVICFSTFFFLKDDRLLYKAIISVTPELFREKTSKVLSSAKRLLTKYFWGLILDASIVVVIITCGMLLLGIKNALIIGVLAGVLNVIPYIGPLMSMVFGTLIGITNLLYTNPDSVTTYLVIEMLSLYVFVNLLDGFLIQPAIYSRIVKAHPLEILLVLLVAAQIAGIFGMIVAIPTYSLLRIVIREFLSSWGYLGTKSVEDKK